MLLAQEALNGMSQEGNQEVGLPLGEERLTCSGNELEGRSFVFP